MGVMRLGYVHARVTDLAEARKHYAETLGMRVVDETADTLWLRGWDEWDHHSLVLEEGGVGLVKFGYKVATLEDLDRFERKLTAFGVTVERVSKGENRAVGDGVRFVTPSEHVVELYQDIEYVGRDVGSLNPGMFPRDLVGIGVPVMDHALITAEDPALNERLFMEALDFRPAERLVSDAADDPDLIGTWMFCQHKPHDIAFIKGPNGKLHHWAYKLADWDALRHAGILLSMDDVPISFGPDIHGLTRGGTIYFYDPSGNRNEVFSGGYETYPDFPTMTWTADELPRAAAYITRELKTKHFEIVT